MTAQRTMTATTVIRYYKHEYNSRTFAKLKSVSSAVRIGIGTIQFNLAVDTTCTVVALCIFDRRWLYRGRRGMRANPLVAVSLECLFPVSWNPLPLSTPPYRFTVCDLSPFFTSPVRGRSRNELIRMCTHTRVRRCIHGRSYEYSV